MFRRIAVITTIIVALAAAAGSQVWAAGYKVVGWNNLGMHCMDADFSVFSILPPYNVLIAQVVDGSGRLVSDPSGLTVTYQAVADPDGSINRTSVGKTLFWKYVGSLFGATLDEDHGLAGANMPGSANTPQPMTFDSANKWFTADGVPITPYDDSKRKNPYPLMRITVRNSSGTTLATTDVVLPVSDEMDCSACHASGSGNAARPSAGWVEDSDPQKDYRLNILRLHDDRQPAVGSYQAMLSSAGYLSSGLYETAASGTPVLCARCHGSNALPGTGIAGVSKLTAAMHGHHAGVTDPTNGMTLDASANRSACYRCHPGSETRCLRGAMGAAVAADGSMAMQCQNCHGVMSQVGLPSRIGWLEQPSCQQCHTGTATRNNGQIRYTSVFEPNGQARLAVDGTFATDDGAPLPGFSLYRFSTGHGGLQCEACHGATHAEYPSSHRNDNLAAIAFQGHAGTLSECASCHGTSPETIAGGPHGMHPVGATWVDHHGDAAEDGRATACQACHGSDYRGTVLSRSFADRTLSTEWGTKTFWRGFQVGCYGCHNGPSSESASPNHPAAVKDLTAATPTGVPVAITLQASDADGNPLTLRVVSQPARGTVGLAGKVATYYPETGFSGIDAFTYAAWDGSTDSNLGHVTVTVAATGCTVSCGASVPATATTGAAVSFAGSADTGSCGGTAAFEWNFGDGSPHAFTASAQHAYATAGTYTWTLTVSADGQSCERTGVITVSTPPCTTPVITSQPQDITILRSSRATLRVVASGSGPLSYQWYRGTSPSTASPIAGATKSTYTTPLLTRTASYWVRVKGPCGTAASRTVKVTVSAGGWTRGGAL